MTYNNWKGKNLSAHESQYFLEMKTKQDIICAFFQDLLMKETFIVALQQFEQIFINYEQSEIPSHINKALEDIVKVDDEEVFLSTLKRCCYILCFPLVKQKKYSEIKNLIKIFRQIYVQNNIKNNLLKADSLVKNKLKIWVNNFRDSLDYEDLKLLTYFGEPESFNHWTHRYLEYLFVSQYFNSDNSVEQKDTALLMFKRIKKNFKFDLAMFFTKYQLGDRNTSNLKNINNKIINFIKSLALRKGNLNYKTLAHIFLQQTKDLTYLKFQLAFMKYLEYSLYDKKGLKLIASKLGQKLQELYQGNNEKKLNEAFLLRTCNKCFDLLLIEKEQPSNLFILFMSGSNPYNMVILLLKIILISPSSRSHLDQKMGDLMAYYRNFPESECQWFINFIEVFRITFAIYGDNDVEYSMVKIKPTSSQGTLASDLDSYQFFLQYSKKKQK